MAKKGLSKDQIIEAAVALIGEGGYDSFSLRTLAAKLGVQPASLYNHVEGIDEISTEIALYASEMMRNALNQAMEGKEPDQAFIDAALAYRQFAAENPEIYKALVHMPLSHDENVRRAGFQSFHPLRDLINSYGLTRRDAISFSRGLRSVMHGFIELTNNGFMQKDYVTRDESYLVIIESYLTYMKAHLAGKDVTKDE